MRPNEIKDEIRKTIDTLSPRLTDLSSKIHKNPEIGWEEVKAAGWLTDFLTKHNFKVEQGIAGLPTALRADYRGRGKPVIAFMAEYDALPKIGHGCGHNIIAAAAAGAAAGSKILADDCGAAVVFMGCPAEELLGGKIHMVEKGMFDEIDAAIQMHPTAGPDNPAGFNSTACTSVDVEFFGQEAHAASAPWKGLSALEALIQVFNNINSLRLHLRDGSRITGIITNGGDALNIVPSYTSGKFQIRSEEEHYLDELKERVVNCIQG
ncbi:MAG: amidohydrolase, partial [Desulfobacterales bacterium]|nr:amidohydrolase [Desulfobacterales bacterium]